MIRFTGSPESLEAAIAAAFPVGGISVHPRTVAPPWERERLEGSRLTYVGREADVAPEVGPLELYRQAFPDRYVRWEVKRQLFEVREHNPRSGHDERIELVFILDAPPDKETGTPRSPEELAAMMQSNSIEMRRCFRHFDYEFVNRRIREANEIQTLGIVKYTDNLMERNRRREKSRRRDTIREMAAGLNEIKRYLPVMAGLRDDGRASPQVTGFGAGTLQKARKTETA